MCASQKGLFLDSPHRHNAMPTVVDRGFPLKSEIETTLGLDRLSSSMTLGSVYSGFKLESSLLLDFNESANLSFII